jgi:hypothetical protein
MVCTGLAAYHICGVEGALCHTNTEMGCGDDHASGQASLESRGLHQLAGQQRGWEQC